MAEGVDRKELNEKIDGVITAIQIVDKNATDRVGIVNEHVKGLTKEMANATKEIADLKARVKDLEAKMGKLKK